MRQRPGTRMRAGRSCTDPPVGRQEEEYANHDRKAGLTGRQRPHPTPL